MKSNVIIQKKNEVYLTVQAEPHVQHELAWIRKIGKSSIKYISNHQNKKPFITLKKYEKTLVVYIV